jgi:1,4-dihydroxy-2-naphthoate octaprenyltransferase
MNRIVGLWVHAARPKTLSAAFAPVLVGTAIAGSHGVMHLPSALAALAGAFLIQIGTNFANDYGDFRSGADAHDRKGPLRITQAGLVSPAAMLRATVLVFAAACVVSAYLVWRAGWPLLVVGFLAIASGILYTAGPWPLGYLGLGDVFVLVFFGPVAVGGTYYAQALALPAAVPLAGLGPGLLAVAILIVNNLRDVDGDALAGKRTLAVRFGRTFARCEYVACIVGAALVPVVLFLGPAADRPFVLLAAPVLPLMARAIRTVCGSDDADALNPMLGATALGLLAYSILFAVGWVL